MLLKLFKLCRKGLFPVFGGRLDLQKPLVDVEDVAHALILAATKGGPGETYLVTSGVRHTLGEMLAIAGSLSGNPRPYWSLPLPIGPAGSAATTPLARLVGLRTAVGTRTPRPVPGRPGDRHRQGAARTGLPPALPRPALDAGTYLRLVWDERSAVTNPSTHTATALKGISSR